MSFHVIDILICQKNPDEEVKVSLERVLSFFHINELKTQQLQILETLLQTEDIVAVLTTGHGKSLPV